MSTHGAGLKALLQVLELLCMLLLQEGNLLPLLLELLLNLAQSHHLRCGISNVSLLHLIVKLPLEIV